MKKKFQEKRILKKQNFEEEDEEEKICIVNLTLTIYLEILFRIRVTKSRNGFLVLGLHFDRTKIFLLLLCDVFDAGELGLILYPKTNRLINQSTEWSVVQQTRSIHQQSTNHLPIKASKTFNKQIERLITKSIDQSIIQSIKKSSTLK